MEEFYLGRDVKSKLLSGINKLANNVKVTLGPEGNTVILYNNEGKPIITKDGVSVAKAFSLKDPIENTGCTLAKEVAKKTADEAGDGTTTSTVLIQSFIKEGFKFLEDGGTYNELKAIFNKSIPAIIDDLKLSASSVTPSNIKDVATVSANNDSKIGEIIQMAFNYSTNVKVEQGKDVEDSIEFLEGSKFDTTYMSKTFITNPARNTAELKNAKVLLVDGKIKSLKNFKSILQYCNQNELPLVIISEFITEDTLRLLETNQINKSLQLLPIKTPGFAKYRKEYIKDIQVITGAEIITDFTKGVNYNMLGEIESVTATPNSTIFVPKDQEAIGKRIQDLIELRDNGDIDDYSREVLNKRIEVLNGKISLIKVGGKSEVEMKERYDRFEDAVLASSSAIEEGVVTGGGLALYRIASSNAYHDVISNTLRAPLKTIVENGFDEDKLLKDFPSEIVDPVKVTRCALQNAASIAITILGTESIVLPNYLW